MACLAGISFLKMLNFFGHYTVVVHRDACLYISKKTPFTPRFKDSFTDNLDFSQKEGSLRQFFSRPPKL